MIQLPDGLPSFVMFSSQACLSATPQISGLSASFGLLNEAAIAAEKEFKSVYNS